MQLRLFNKNNIFNTTTPTKYIVDKKLIRGDREANPFTLYQLKKNGVNQIIDLRCLSVEKKQAPHQILERLMCKALGIKYLNIKYNHKITNIPEMDFFENINNLIVNNPQKTYIHCRHGKRRTGICVAIYEKFHTSKSSKEIIDELYNIGFSELQNNKKIPEFIRIRLSNIYKNFIEKFYPNETTPLAKVHT